MTEIKGKFLKEPGTRGSLIRVEPGEAVSAGSEGPKHFVEASVINPRNGGEERSAGRFFFKDLKQRELSVEDVLDKYRWLKSKGLPVVPMLRYNKENNALLMTDMSGGGKRILVDRHHPLRSSGIRINQIVNWKALNETVMRIATEAYDDGNGMELDDDNYMIVLDKIDGGYWGSVYLADIGYGANFLRDVDPTRRSYATLEENWEWARTFVREIQEQGAWDNRSDKIKRDGEELRP